MWKNITIPILILIILGLVYFNRNQVKDLSRQATAVEAYKDTLHTFKTQTGSEGGYISTIQGDKNSILALLTIEKNKNKELVDLLDSNKNVVNATSVKTITKIKYISEPDTVLKGIKFTKNIHTNWIDEIITIDSNKLSRTLSYKDAYVFHMDKKPNKGLFSGSTLTTYVEPQNPDTKVTGLTSISTVVDQRKPRLGAFVGPALNIDKTGKVALGVSVGVGLTF